MNFLKDAVYTKPTFEKNAEYELPKNISEWNEEVLKNFFTEIPFLPKDVGVDVVINNVDENKGYAKGSVVVFYKTKKINFPIIVKDFKMFPFDIFVAENDGNPIFMNASERNVKTALLMNEIGEIKNMYDFAYGQNLKTPGGVNPKPSVPLDQAYHDFVIQDQAMFNLRKMSCLKNASVEDLEKLAIQLEAEPNVRESFNETTGDLKQQVVDLLLEKRKILKEKDQGKLDLGSVVKAKRTTVALDSEFFDVNELKPIKPPSTCEIRLYEYPSMDDFMGSGESALSRLQATKVGKAIAGIVVAYKDSGSYDGNCCASCPKAIEEMTDEEKKKEVREQIDQIFISADGKYYNIRRDHQKTGIMFYGSNIMGVTGLMEKVIRNMENHALDFFRFEQANHHDGSDKAFNPMWLQNEGKISGRFGIEREKRYSAVFGNPESSNYDRGIFVLYGAGDVWECMEFSCIHKTWTVEGRKIYIGHDVAVIPANVASVQKVASVDVLTQPAYKMAIGCAKNIYLVPENSVVLSRMPMKCIDDSDIMEPSKTVKMAYEEQAINKVSVYLGGQGYNIDGAPVDAFKKIAGLKGEMDTNTALVTLNVMGVNPERGREILKTALDKQSVTVYGVRNDYVNYDAFKPMEKNARVKNLMHQIADELKVNLVKEASVIEDPEAVDTVLSLNFINEDNIQDYINNIAAMKRISCKLASMLIASRMGLADIDEGAARKAIDGLDKVVEGLENVKLAVGK